MKRVKQTDGITLVALVITIIIMLILAAISIQALTNQGIFGRANDAKRESEIASIKEKIALDIYQKQLEPPVGSITEDQLKTILENHGTIIYEEDGVTIKGITTGKGYEILLKDIYGGETVAESVPDGAIVTPVNDITTWLKTGGISKQYSYTTIEQVIADSTCTKSLMNNENAMKYLARSTEFADSICARETAMTHLGDSAYVDDTVLNSDLWVSSISSSSYWDLIYPSVTVHSSASATITVAGKSFTSDATGNTEHSIPWGTFNIYDSVSEQSFECTIDRNTTDVWVMPEGLVLYWYGYINNYSKKDFSFSNGIGYLTYLEGATTINVNCISYTSGENNSNRYTGYSTSNQIDLSNYNKIHRIYQNNHTKDNSLCAIFQSSPVDNDKIFAAESHVSGKHENIIDIQSYTGYYYLTPFYVCNGRKETVYAVWLE